MKTIRNLFLKKYKTQKSPERLTSFGANPIEINNYFTSAAESIAVVAAAAVESIAAVAAAAVESTIVVAASVAAAAVESTASVASEVLFDEHATAAVKATATAINLNEFFILFVFVFNVKLALNTGNHK